MPSIVNIEGDYGGNYRVAGDEPTEAELKWIQQDMARKRASAEGVPLVQRQELTPELESASFGQLTRDPALAEQYRSAGSRYGTQQNLIDAGISMEEASARARETYNLAVADVPPDKQTQYAEQALQHDLDKEVQVRRSLMDDGSPGPMIWRPLSEEKWRIWNSPTLNVNDLYAAAPHAKQIGAEIGGAVLGAGAGAATGLAFAPVAPYAAFALGTFGEGGASYVYTLARLREARRRGLQLSDDEITEAAASNMLWTTGTALGVGFAGLVYKRIMGRLPAKLRKVINETEGGAEQLRILEQRFGEEANAGLTAGQAARQVGMSREATDRLLNLENTIMRQPGGERLRDVTEQQGRDVSEALTDDYVRGYPEVASPERSLAIGEGVKGAMEQDIRQSVLGGSRPVQEGRRGGTELADQLGRMPRSPESIDMARHGQNVRKYAQRAHDQELKRLQEQYRITNPVYNEARLNPIRLRQELIRVRGEMGERLFTQLAEADESLTGDVLRRMTVRREPGKSWRQGGWSWRLNSYGGLEKSKLADVGKGGPDWVPASAKERAEQLYKPVSMDTIDADLSALGREIRRREQGPDQKEVMYLNRLRNALVRDRQAFLRGIDPETRDLVEARRADYAAFAEAFEEGAVGNMLKRPSKRSAYTMRNEEVVKSMLEDSQAAEQFARATKDSRFNARGALFMARRGVWREYNDRFLKGKKMSDVNADAVRDWVDQHSTALGHLMDPEDIARMKRPAAAARELKKREAVYDQQMKDVARSIGVKMQDWDVNVVVEKLWQKGNYQKIDEVMRVLERGTDKSLLEDFKTASIKHAFHTSNVLQRPNYASDNYIINPKKLDELVNNTGGTNILPHLQRVYGPRYIQNLKTVNRLVQRYNRFSRFDVQMVQEAGLGMEFTGLGRFVRVAFPPLTRSGRTATGIKGVITEGAAKRLSEILTNPQELSRLASLRRVKTSDALVPLVAAQLDYPFVEYQE